MSQIWRCNTCGIEAAGTIEELTDEGWVRLEVVLRERRRANKATFQGCPTHTVEAAEAAHAFVRVSRIYHDRLRPAPVADTEVRQDAP